MPGCVGRSGLAPCASSRRIAARSPALAARSSGVAPMRQHAVGAAVVAQRAVRREQLQLQVRVRRRPSSSMLDHLQAGRLVERGPVGAAAVRQRVHVHGRVDAACGPTSPTCSTSAPCCTRYAATSKWKLSVASSSGRDASGSVRFTSAPAVDQDLRALQAALARGVQQRREAAGRARLHARLGGDLPLPVVDASSAR